MPCFAVVARREPFFVEMSLLAVVLCDSFVAARIAGGPESPDRQTRVFAETVKPAAQLERHFIRFPDCELSLNDSKQVGIS
jgi:hypothetical protein